MESTIDFHRSLLRAHGVSHESATVILSSGMKVLYASPAAQDVLRDLKEAVLRPDVTVPPPILAYIGQRVMKQIQMQRVQADYAPIFDQCSIRSVHRTYQCSSLGIPSKTAIDLAQIILVLCEDRWTSLRLQTGKSPRRSLWAPFSILQSLVTKAGMGLTLRMRGSQRRVLHAPNPTVL